MNRPNITDPIIINTLLGAEGSKETSAGLSSVKIGVSFSTYNFADSL